jgi:general secretion pathway protein L
MIVADWFILRMPKQAGELASWLVCAPDGRMLLPTQTGRLLQAAPVAANRRVIVLAPATEVVITAAELPAKASAAKLAQVVPFALEEQLADDVDDLHFAVGRRPADGVRTPVAIVARTQMTEWLTALSAAGVQPDAMHAESDLLPRGPGQTVALLEPDAITICRGGGAPVSLPPESLVDAFELAEGVRDAGSMQAPQQLVLYVSPEQWMRREADAEPLRKRFSALKVQLLPNGPLPLFAQQIAGGTPIDLLQGAFGRSTGLAVGLAPWRIAAALALALLGLHFAGKVLELNQLKKTERELDGALDAAYRSALPGESMGADARARVEERLAAVRGGGGNAFLAAMSALAQARGASPGAMIEALSFNSNTLDLRVGAPDAASIDRISQQLRATGWRADLTSGNARPKGYEGRLQVKPAGGA